MPVPWGRGCLGLPSTEPSSLSALNLMCTHDLCWLKAQRYPLGFFCWASLCREAIFTWPWTFLALFLIGKDKPCVLKVKTKRRDLFQRCLWSAQPSRNWGTTVPVCVSVTAFLPFWFYSVDDLLAGEAPLWDHLRVDKSTKQKATKEKSKWVGGKGLWNHRVESCQVRAFSGNSCKVNLVKFCLERKKRKTKVMVSSSRRQELFVTAKYKVYSSFLFSHLLCFHSWIYFSPGYTGSSWEGKVCMNSSSLAIVLKQDWSCGPCSSNRGLGGFPCLVGVWVGRVRLFMLHIVVIPATHRKSWAVLAEKVLVHLYRVGQASRGRNRHQAILFGQLHFSCLLTTGGISVAKPQREE